MKKNPFASKIDSEFEVSRAEPSYLDFDQSSVDPRFGSSYFEEEKRSLATRLWLTVVVLVFGIFFFRLADLTLVQGSEYRAVAEGNRLRIQYILAPRGVVYDSQGEVLATNEPSFELVATASDLPQGENERAVVINRITDLFGTPYGEILRLLEQADPGSYLPITIKQDIDHTTAVRFLAETNMYPGFSIESAPQRLYHNGISFAHLLGYTGKLTSEEYESNKTAGYRFNDVIGKTGLEAYYERDLRGRLGERLVEVDAQGIVKNEFQRRNPEPGSDVRLFVDGELQRTLYATLARQAELQRVTKAAAIALDPKTGGILAMVSIASFDPNEFATGISAEAYAALAESPNQPLFNRGLSGTYPPGSTVKPFFGPAALAEGIVNERTKIYDGGAIYIPNQFDPSITYTFRGWNPAGLGDVDVRQAIAKSSDIFFYTVGGGQASLGIPGLGPDRLARYLRAFYFGSAAGIDLPGEASGLVPDPDWKADYFTGAQADKIWYLGDTYNMSIGQGFVLATPLQVAVATAAIANGGKVMQPRVVQSILGPDDQNKSTYTPLVLNENFLPSSAIRAAQEGMRMTVTEGTARSLATLSLAVAGKTGTSQFDGSDPTRTHAWFTAYAPYEDPEIVLTVLVEAGGEGSGAAAAVAREVLDWYSKNRVN